MFDPKKAHYIVATCIVVKDGKFLIAKRSEEEERWSGRWTVPGGKLEKDEYMKRPHDTKEGQWYNVFEDLVRREVKEEVGLDIKNIKYLTSLAFKREDGVPTIIVSLYADNDEGAITLSDELTDYRWITIEEAENYDLIDGIYEELEMLDRVLKGEEIREWKKLD
ncbi:NUDIX domain-containing protein [Candidatus Woesearchaeota archaeon]|nr:NUDIX domain-containing protein [Candidatus Woesearchaeota archaeon]